MPLVTPAYAAVFGLVFIVLAIRTIKLRRQFGAAVGDAGQAVLTKAIRAHANFAEYVPLTLLLIFMHEQMVETKIITHVLCVLLLVGRLVHARALSQVDEPLTLRVVGMALTFTTIASAAIAIGVAYFL